MSVIIDDSFTEHFIADRERCTNISAYVTVSALLQVFLARVAVVTAPHKHILYIFKDYGHWLNVFEVKNSGEWGIKQQLHSDNQTVQCSVNLFLPILYCM